MIALPWATLDFTDPRFRVPDYEVEAWPHVTVPEDGVAIDVGAHQGFYATKLAREAGEDGTVVVVEPNPDNFRQLRENLRRNDLTGNVIFVESALSDYWGHGVMLTYPPEKASGKHFLRGTDRREAFYQEYVDGTSIRTDARETAVEVTTLDRVIGISGLRRLDLVKIDTEGAELRILRGGAHALATLSPNVVLEVHHDMLNEITAYLTTLGYACLATGSMRHSDNPYAVFAKGRRR